MSRQSWALIATVVVLAGAVVGGVVLLSAGGPETPAAQARPVSTQTVQRGALSAIVAQAGILTYRARSGGAPYTAINQADGIYTRLPGVGDRVGCGDVLYRVDDDPVLLLCGAVPAYRDLQIGDHGTDVRQLSRNLRELGYADAPAGATFSSATQAALEKLQRARGLAATGTLDLDDAVFLPRPVRIAKVTGQLGGLARPGAPVAQATSDRLEVQVSLDPSRRGEVKAGDRARITLPDNTTINGRVDRLGGVAQAATKDGAPGAATIPASIGLDDPRKARGLDQAPVRVEITTKGVENALSVPVVALVGRSGGGFAVEVVGDGGRRALVAVRLGLFDTASGRVQVEGDLRAGERVAVPSL